MAERLARLIGRWRWSLLAAWIALLGVAGVVGAPLPTMLSGGGWSVPGSDSAYVAEHVSDGFVARGASNVTVVVHDRWYTHGQPGFDKRVTRAIDEISENPDLEVASRIGYASAGEATRDSFIGDDGRTVTETLGLGIEDGMARQSLPAVQHDLTETYADQGLDVSLVGTAPFWGEVNHLSEQGLVKAELLTLPLILLVLVSIFRGVVAALVSVSVAVTAILASFAVLALAAGHWELSIFVQNTATMLGLGVGVDYSLFVIARFREELARGATVADALSSTLRTAGETVLFSGITIVAAMSTLFLVPLGVISSIALGAVIVVAFAVLSSVLILPVLLRLLGHRINAGRVRLPARVSRGPRSSHRRELEPRWRRLTLMVMRRPVTFLTVGVVTLLALAVPALGMTTFTPDAQIVPTSSPVRQGFDRMQDQFGTGSTSPIRVLVTADDPLTGDSEEVTSLADRLAELDSVDRIDSALPLLAQASPEAPLAALDPAVRSQLPDDARALVGHFVAKDARRLILDVIPAERAAAPATQDLLADVRDTVDDAGIAGADIRVGGETAEGVESNAIIQDKMPLVVAVMLVVIYVLLLITFRSVLLPLKAILMNLVSVAATFGVLTLVFQHGVGAGLLGLDGATDIQNFVPVLLLTLLFSLSTDYEVFLLSRVREHYLASRDNTASVAEGMASTAPLISGAALLMIVVFGAFAVAGILPIQQLGFGMAVAIAIDATIVRLLLVPASMRLMGRLNWWMPSFRRRRPRPTRHTRRAEDVPVATPTSHPRRHAITVGTESSP